MSCLIDAFLGLSPLHERYRMKSRTAPIGFLGKIVTTLLAAGLLVVGFMFSIVILAVVAVLGLIGLGYFWWKTRALRRAIREQMAAARSEQSTVIEGEASVVREASGQQPHLVTFSACRTP